MSFDLKKYLAEGRLINKKFAFYDECVKIAEDMEEHMYNTMTWYLPLQISDADEKEAMEQIIAILEKRINQPNK